MKGMQETLLELALILGTGHQQPMLMDDYTHLLLKDEHYNTTKQLMHEFQQDLARWSERLRERNALRKAKGRFEFHRFDPRMMRTSVSV